LTHEECKTYATKQSIFHTGGLHVARFARILPLIEVML